MTKYERIKNMSIEEVRELSFLEELLQRKPTKEELEVYNATGKRFREFQDEAIKHIEEQMKRIEKKITGGKK